MSNVHAIANKPAPSSAANENPQLSRTVNPGSPWLTVGDVPHDRLLGLRDVIKYVDLSRSEIYRRIKKGTFPAQIHVGSRVMWSENEVQGWIAQAKRDGQTAARSVSR